MALIKTSLPSNAFTDEVTAETELVLTISVPGQENIQVLPLSPDIALL